MGVYANPNQTDVEKKAAIVAFLTHAANGGASAIATMGKVTGPQTIYTIRHAIGGLTSETTRLVNALVDAGTIVRNFNGSENDQKWTYSIP